MVEVLTANQQAKQQMNQMYLSQTGAKVQKSVIEWFLSGTLFFQITSALFSAFGFYYDFRDSLGIIGAIILGIALGVFIEISKDKSVKGAFASFEPLSKILLGGIAFILMTIALTYHYKSMITFKNVSIKDDLQTQVNFEREQILTTNKNIEDLINNNTEIAKVLSNGKGGDDYYATESMKSNTELMATLTTLNGSSRATELLLEQSKKSAEQNSNTLLLLFITMEFFSLFGVIGKIILSRNTEKGVKQTTNTMDKLNAIESNVYMATETALIDRTMQNINKYLWDKGEQKQPHPTHYLPHKEKHLPVKKESSVTEKEITKEIDECFKLLEEYRDETPTNRALYDQAHGGESQKQETETEQKTTDIDDITDRYIDLSSYNHKQQMMLQIMFDHGNINKPNQKLIPKRFVLSETGADKKEYENLASSLEDAGYIYIKAGSGWMSNCKGIKIVVAVRE